MTEVNPVDGIGPPYGITRVVPDGFYTREQAAQQVGKSRDTLRRWQKSEKFAPTHTMQVGQLRVWLYTEEDIGTLKRLAETIKPGRPRGKDEDDNL